MKKELKEIMTLDSNSDVSSLLKRILNKVFISSIVGVVLFSVLLILPIVFKSTFDRTSFISYSFFFILILFSFFFFVFYLINSFLNKNKLLNYELFKKELIKLKIFDSFNSVCKVIMCFLFVTSFFCNTSKIVGNSMNDTYNNNDYIFVWHFFYEPKTDDVVIIDVGGVLDTDFIIKRVVATSSDIVEYIDYSLYVNGEFVCLMSIFEYNTLLTNVQTNESYDQVPEGYSIVLGDNRNNSIDSRKIGLVENDNILGKSIFRFFPFSNIGIVDSDIK